MFLLLPLRRISSCGRTQFPRKCPTFEGSGRVPVRNSGIEALKHSVTYVPNFDGFALKTV